MSTWRTRAGRGREGEAGRGERRGRLAKHCAARRRGAPSRCRGRRGRSLRGRGRLRTGGEGHMSRGSMRHRSESRTLAWPRGFAARVAPWTERRRAVCERRGAAPSRAACSDLSTTTPEEGPEGRRASGAGRAPRGWASRGPAAQACAPGGDAATAGQNRWVAERPGRACAPPPDPSAATRCRFPARFWLGRRSVPTPGQPTQQMS